MACSQFIDASCGKVAGSYVRVPAFASHHDRNFNLSSEGAGSAQGARLKSLIRKYCWISETTVQCLVVKTAPFIKQG
jgi:hypothetical protein